MSAVQLQPPMPDDIGLGPLQPCDRCHRLTDIRLLDAVLLDADGNEASGEAYCKPCHALVATIPSDRWRPLA